MSEERETWQYSAAVLAIVCPPIAVYIAQGSFDTTAMISIFLTLLLWFPGIIHALHVVMTIKDEEEVVEEPPAMS